MVNHGFKVAMESRREPAILPMNLGGVRVPSNPDLFWRSSMSGLDGFRLGDYSSTESRPTVQGRNARTKFGVFSFWPRAPSVRRM